MDDLHLFKPTTSGKDRLKGVGILGKHQALSFNIALSQTQQNLIAKALVQVNRRISNSRTSDFMMARKKVIPNKLCLTRGKVKWDDAIESINHLEVSTSHKWMQPQSTRPQTQAANCLLSCPICGKSEPSSCCGAFQIGHLDNKHRCAHCNKATPVVRWKCCCGGSWAFCTEHRFCLVPDTNTRRRTTTLKRKPCRKPARNTNIRRRCEPNYEDLLDGDRRRLARKRKREAEFTLGTQPLTSIPNSLLGPTLKRRFKR